jgi:hypothetical protein
VYTSDEFAVEVLVKVGFEAEAEAGFSGSNEELDVLVAVSAATVEEDAKVGNARGTY